MCEQLPDKGKTPFCHLRKSCWVGVGGAQIDRRTGEADNTGSRIKRELLSKDDRKARQRERGAFNL